MSEYSRALGECIYQSRKSRKLTQAELAERIGVNEQTIRKIEHYDSNPKFEALVPLIRELQIDPAEFFYPEEPLDDSAKKRLDMLLAECSEAQLEALIPIIRATLEVLRGELVAANE